METERLLKIVEENGESYEGTDPIKDAMLLHNKSMHSLRSKTLRDEEGAVTGL